MPEGAAGVHLPGTGDLNEPVVFPHAAEKHREIRTSLTFEIPADLLASDSRISIRAARDAPGSSLNKEDGNRGLDRAKVLSNVDGILGDTGLSQKASRGSGYGRETGIIDLGHEPPLSVDGSEAAVIDRRRVSVQWFSGTILTGLCGAALIGGAVFASLDGEMTFAKVQ